jgi:hypothetical protein
MEYQSPVLQDISAQRKLAEKLMEQQDINGQMVSGHYVAPSWTQHLARALNPALGAYIGQKADAKEKTYNDTKSAKMAELLKGMSPQQVQNGTTQPMQAPERTFDQFGSPTQGQDLTPQPQGAPVPNMQMETPQQQMQRVQPEVLQYMQQYGNTPEAQYMLAQLGKQDDRAYAQGQKVDDRQYADTREDKLYTRNRGDQVADREDNQEFQRIQAKDEQGFQLTQQEKQFAQAWKLQQSSQQNQNYQNAASRAQAERLAGSNAAPIQVLDPATGKPIYVPRNQAIGMRPYSAADDAKQTALDAKVEAKKDGASIVDSNIALLRDAYKQLDTDGGIVSSNGSTRTNIGARLGSSGLGQTIGGALGTKNQTQRDIISQTRPLLLQSIMKATGMSAKQMDSNAELKLWLSTATDNKIARGKQSSTG